MSRGPRFGLQGCAVLLLTAAPLFSQDPVAELSHDLYEATGERLKISLLFRTRLETRTGVDFGRDPNMENPLFRTRLGAQFTPAPWLKLVGMTQDCRAPYYGGPAPSSARDTVDLMEGYLELFPDRKRGFGMLIGRQIFGLGEGRVIGISDWTNTARSYDVARFYYRLPHARLEFLLVSQTRVRMDDFNRPEPGERLWGMYHSFPEVIRKSTVEFYALRRDQNHAGGFAGPGRLAIETFGGRLAGPLAAGVNYSLEGAGQTGKVGLLPHRAHAWYASVSRTLQWRLPLDLEVEYKYASGSVNSTTDGTFDQLYAANHDKFGHQDMFGWRNLHNLRSVDTLHLSKKLALNFQYNNNWLVSARDALYNGSGKALFRSANGTAGRHVGQEADVYATVKWRCFTYGAGFTHFFVGEFLRKVTPGVNTRYIYVFQTYSF